MSKDLWRKADLSFTKDKTRQALSWETLYVIKRLSTKITGGRVGVCVVLRDMPVHVDAADARGAPSCIRLRLVFPANFGEFWRCQLQLRFE